MSNNSDKDALPADHASIYDHSRLPNNLLRVNDGDEYLGWSPESRNTVRVSAPAEEVLKKIQDALDSHAQTERRSDALETAINSGTCDMAQVTALLAANKASMASIKDFLTSCRDSFPTRMRPTEQSHIAATKVFGTAELFEAIVLHLEPRDILQAMRINRTAVQLFTDSPKLQDKLQLRPSSSGHLSNNIATDFPGFTVSVDDGDAIYDATVSGNITCFGQVAIVARIGDRSFLSVGARCRSMLIIQPALLAMKVTVSCCAETDRRAFDDHHWGPRAVAHFAYQPQSGAVEGSSEDDGDQDDISEDEDKTGTAEDPDAVFNKDVVTRLEIRCKTGITVGHIYDAVERLREAHVKCPHAPIYEHDSEGKVKPTITFATMLTLNNDDPYLLEKDMKDIRGRLRHTAGGINGDVMQVYIDSKKRAFENEWPILTFDEFKMKYMADDPYDD